MLHCGRLPGLRRATRDAPDPTIRPARQAPSPMHAPDPSTEFDPQAVETAAQSFWERTRAFEVTEEDPRPTFYCLSMLPYPSGALHMGHVRNYTIGDVVSRFQRMQGRNVLQPMGWDAFGLPAENAAIRNRVPPAQWTYRNIEHMRGQLKRMGFAYDWSREFATCRPEYYVHEQRMFVRLFRKGLVYRRNSVVNWDPVDQTVLANEQVIDGRGWRSGALVEKREIPQWFLKITDYAQELLDGLDHLPGWPDAVKTMQRNWIGRSEGLELDFEVADSGGESLRVFTTRPDTLMGVTYMAVAAEHPLAKRAAAGNPALAAFVEECRRGGTSEAELETQEKRGMATGLFVLHPVSGERLPIWVANFVLMGYGTGAVMAVPGHDQRDFEFAHRYDLPIRQVIALCNGEGEDTAYDPQQWKDWYADKSDPRMRVVNSGELDGMDYRQAFDHLVEKFEAAQRGTRRVNFRLRDWGVSRQRYWGCPIPMVHCATCDAVPVPENELPVLLPEDVEFMGTGSPIKSDPEWRRTTCPQCGGPAERETDTFDTFMESSWYYARYCSPGAEDILDRRAEHWLPVDLYIGGIEHAILHLLYFRFYHKLLRDSGYVKSDEPATNLLCQGMVVAETFHREDADGGTTWFNPAEVDIQRDERARVVGATLRADGQPVRIGGIEKMSKSKNNGVDPQAMVDRFGADTVRLFSMFAAPPDQSLEWNEAGVEGMSRFLRRLWSAAQRHAAAGPAAPLDPAALDRGQRDLRRKLHETIAKVGDDLGRRHAFNTAIAAVMELLNAMTRFEDASAQGRAVLQEAFEATCLLLNPIAPHACHALWQALGHPETLLEDLRFPEADPAALKKEAVTLAVQVNGKRRAEIEVAADASREQVEAAALSDANVQRFLEGRSPHKVIVVPGKIVNIVLPTP